ncbi:hypothetical protein HK102_003832 [Quaeritorhiza haematococci]|nr:hypothetical protein HK102_003832 [Quaeritorhiza haematococci]
MPKKFSSFLSHTNKYSSTSKPPHTAYASGFKVSYFNSYKVVEVTGGNKYVLYMCNSPRPTVEGATAYVEIPVSKVGVTDLPVVGYMERLGVRQSIAYIQPLESATPACIRVLSQQNAIVDSPARVTGSPVVAVFGTGAAGQTNTTFIPVNAAITSEQTPLARGEWLKFVAAFYNLDGASQSQFQTIAAQYECSSKYLRGNSFVSDNDKRKVAWVGRFDNVWSMPDETFITNLISDAGGIVVKHSAQNSMDEFHAHLRSADVVVDATPTGNVIYGQKDFEQLAGLVGKGPEEGYNFMDYGGALWRFDRLRNAMHDDYPVSAWSQPEIVLADLVHAINVTWNPSFRNVFFRNLANGDEYSSISNSSCTNVAAPFSPRGAGTTCLSLDGSKTGAGNGNTPVTVGPPTNGVAIAVGVSVGVALLIIGALVTFTILRKKRSLIRKWYKMEDSKVGGAYPMQPPKAQQQQQFGRQAQMPPERFADIPLGQA